MRVHIVNPYGSVAMQRMSEPLTSELPKLYEVTMSAEVDTGAAVNIHLPFHTLCEDKDFGNGKHIAVYTHCNPGAQPELYQACARADMVTAMSFRGRQELLDLGVEPSKIWVIPCASGDFTYRPRRVLIVGYPQPNGRKRESILFDLAFRYDLTPYEFILAGGGWEKVAANLSAMGVRGEVVNTLDDDKMATLYQTADVMVVTGYLEGGPLPLLEAMATGTKVLSPRFGYAADYLDAADLYDGPDELMRKLDELSAQSIHYHKLARAWTWNDYAAEYALILGRLLGVSVDLYPERGMSRYTQLLDIIDRERPRSICEIGTWTGSTAIRMLQQASKYHPMKRLSYQGFDLFDEQTGEQFVRELSKMAMPLRVVEKRIKATGANVELIAGDTRDILNITIRLSSDFIFVDGGHSEDTIRNDGGVALEILELSKKAVVIFDDYYHDGKPGGLGCNKFIDGLDSNDYEVTHLPVKTLADDGRLIGMVQVKRADLRVQVRTESYQGGISYTITNGTGKDVRLRSLPLSYAPGNSTGPGDLERPTAP